MAGFCLHLGDMLGNLKSLEKYRRLITTCEVLSPMGLCIQTDPTIILCTATVAVRLYVLNVNNSQPSSQKARSGEPSDKAVRSN